ncbi:MAG: CaiB/BaiF CoA transferase family protein [Dehalococcoidia bacterium]
MPEPHDSGPLSGYRVLDLTGSRGQLCGRLLCELGADVIKVEPRVGDPARDLGPFYRSDEGPEHSLWWWAMNAGKRSITCELRLEAGREMLRKLAEKSDFFIETFTPGTTREMKLDYASLAERNPGIIVVSITPFGLTGPHANWAATDIVASAAGGHMHLNGDEKNGPVRSLPPQAYAQVSAQAAVGALTALYARPALEGRGQHVDVSMQEAMTLAMDNAQQTWDIRKVNITGPGVRRNIGGFVGMRYLYQTADGWVTALQAGGLVGPNANTMIDWLAASGEAGELDSPAWRERLSAQQPLTEEERALVEERLSAFCRTRRKLDLVEGAQARGAGWAPVFTPGDLVESAHLRDREYWIRVQHEDIGESFVYPGPPFRLSETPWRQRGRAPHIGEHNSEVYAELGLTEQDLRRLKLRMVV